MTEDFGREDEKDVDEQELREAEALAGALERGHAADGLPEDALQTAALVRYAGGGGLDAEREAAILEEVLAAADRVAAAAPAPSGWTIAWRWAFGALGLGAAVAAVLLIVLRPAGGPTALPAPSAALVGAQIDRLSGGDDEAFEAAMRDYRGEVYGALTERYGR